MKWRIHQVVVCGFDLKQVSYHIQRPITWSAWLLTIFSCSIECSGVCISSSYSSKITSTRIGLADDGIDLMESNPKQCLRCILSNGKNIGRLLPSIDKHPPHIPNDENETSSHRVCTTQTMKFMSDGKYARRIRIFIEKLSQSIKVHSLDLTLTASTTTPAMISSIFFSYHLDASNTPMVYQISW